MSAPARSAAAGASVRTPAVADRYAGLDELLPRMVTAADRGEWLDALLLAVGALQITEDWSQGTAWRVRRLVDHYEPRAAGRLSRPAARAARAGVDLATETVSAAPAARAARVWALRLSTLVDRLADLVVDRPTGGTAAGTALRAGLRRAADEAAGLRLPRDDLLRPPSCFTSFDQLPEDAVELATRWSARNPDRDRPLLLVGVRTSGSYLAPLAGAALRRLGYRTVVGTTRPGSALLPGRGAAVRRLRRAGAAVLVLDDPPASGGSLVRVAARAEQVGFPRSAVQPVFALFDDDGRVPERLRAYPCTVLAGSDWAIRRRLGPAALAEALTAVLPAGQRVVAVDAAEPGLPSRWSHLAVALTARIAEDGAVRELPLTAEAAGVGYLGRHAVRTAEALRGLVPRVLGFSDGVLLRERPPGEGARLVSSADAATVARYVAARRERLAVPADLSLRLTGREPVWEVAARVLAPVLGRLDLALRPALLYPLTRALLAADRPCLVDGRTPVGRWVADGAGGWLKTDFTEGAFGHLDLASYDAAFDLAGAAVADGAPAGLRQYWSGLAGERIPDARWCLLQLVQAPHTARLTAGNAASPGPAASARARRVQDGAVQRFLAGTCLTGLLAEPALLPDGAEVQGPWCVLDLDGVLEADTLGFAASSPLGMLALRALRVHGFRTVLASGRSLPEVRERCLVYGLTGGVAEYGSVCFDVRTGATRVLAEPGRQEADARLRRRLAAEPSVTVDPAFRWCVRAWTGAGRRRSALPAELVRTLLAAPGLAGLFVPVPGAAQTDFVPSGTDKAKGVRALFEQLGSAGAVPLLAVGDGVADVPLLRWARHGMAPGNAEEAVRRAGVPVLRHRYQAGLAEAVGRLTGHPPGACPECRPPAVPPDTAALLAVLAVPEAGRPGAPARILRLARAVRALDRTRRSEDGSEPLG